MSGRRPIPTVWLVVLTAFLIGTNYVALQAALEHAEPLSFTSVRAGSGALVLMVVAHVRGERPPPLSDRQTWRGVIVVATLVTTTSSATLAYGVARVSPGLAALLSANMPLFAAILAWIFLHERLARTGFIGLGVGALGAFGLAWPALSGDTSATGFAFMMVATFTWAVGVVTQKSWDLSRISPLMFVALQLVVSSLSMAVLGAIFEGWAVEATSDFAFPLFWSGVVSMAVPFTLMATVISRASATEAAATAYLIPFFGAVVSAVWTGELLEPIEWIGGAFLLVGVWLVNRHPVREVVSADAGSRG
ncbi:MAG: DMT family transporter [Actinomycetia bacterium]|nr:DMT family transporter [Actinomycetes bacterium]